MPTNRELLESLRDGFATLDYRDTTELDRLKKRGQMVIRRVFGAESDYAVELRRTQFHPGVYPASEDHYASRWRSGLNAAINLVDTMIEELDLSEPEPAQNLEEPTGPKSNRVFVVHGHDGEMRESVARVISRLGLEPIILHEQPDRGRTIIEKFYDYSDVGFAVVLLSPDDMGYVGTSDPDTAQPRARQNVILELGFFLGRLGRENVVALHKGNTEIPSDFSGVLFKPYAPDGSWPYKLTRELRESGYEVSADDL